MWTGMAVDATAQAPPAAEGRIDFDRPEAWAMKYFTTASMLIAPSPVSHHDPGVIWLGLGVVWLPTLSSAQQRVGFNGTVEEDLNQAPLFVRPRIMIGLSDRLTLTVAGLPPVKLFGVTPRLFALGLGWTMWNGDQWTVVGRTHGQVGSVTGAITCPADVLSFAPGSAGNPRGCDAQSADVTSLRYLSAELDVARWLTAAERLAVRGSVSLTFVDSAFQTRASTFGFPDRTQFDSRGVTYSATAGVSYAIGGRTTVGLDVFYAPLRIQRPSAPSTMVDGLLTARGLLTYRVR
jgi:hypothetical protein